MLIWGPVRRKAVPRGLRKHSTVRRAVVKISAAIRMLAGGLFAYVVLIRPRLLSWGATSKEREAALPGDELLSAANIQATRAVTVHAPTGRVWPWIVQMGQGRGGLYSYDQLENLVGCDMHSAERIVEEWQALAPGDAFKLHPDAALEVAVVELGRALVVRGGVPLQQDSAPPFDFSWAFVLEARSDHSTRLLVRERYRYTRRWAALVVEPVQAISFLMTEKMLRGIRDRAERHVDHEPRARARCHGPRPSPRENGAAASVR